MKSLRLQHAFLVLLLSCNLAACADDDQSNAATAGGAADTDMASGIPPADSEAIADLNATTDLSTAPAAPTIAESNTTAGATAGAAMDDPVMDSATTAGQVVGNAQMPTSTARCDGLAGQALADCTRARDTEAKTSDSVPSPPAP